jgi:hypothetical protein
VSYQRRSSVVAAAAFLAGAGLLLLAVRPSVHSTIEAHWGHFTLTVLPSLALFGVAAVRASGGLRVALLVLSLIGVFGAGLLHPVCVPISEQERPTFESVRTLEQRAAEGEPFCRLEGRWYQCKSYISRSLFF